MSHSHTGCFAASNGCPVFHNGLNSMRRKCLAMSKQEKNLYNSLIAAKEKINKNCNVAQRNSIKLKQVKHLFLNVQYLALMEKWTSLIKITKLKKYKSSENCHKLTMQQKLTAMTMLNQSPKAYLFLKKVFKLPSPQQLKKLFAKYALDTGINSGTLKQLKLEINQLSRNQRICALVFDEMALKPTLKYDKKEDTLSGLVSNGIKTKRLLADHAQVYMIKGLTCNYKLPIAYTFTSGLITGPDLAAQLKIIISQLQKVGFLVVATVCNEGKNKINALNVLKEESQEIFICENKTGKDNVFLVNNKEIVQLFDPPQLMKAIRDHFLTNHIKYSVDGKTGIAKWNHIQIFYNNLPTYNDEKLIPKLTDEHVVLTKKSKNEAIYAIQILSHTVCAWMARLATDDLIPKECLESVHLIKFFDDLFDSVNGSAGNEDKDHKPLLRAIKNHSSHRKFWIKAKSALNAMAFIDENGEAVPVPTLQNWITTIEGIERLVEKLHVVYGVSFWPRNLCVDALSTFMQSIRRHNQRYKPTAHDFETSFAELLERYWPKFRKARSGSKGFNFLLM